MAVFCDIDFFTKNDNLSYNCFLSLETRVLVGTGMNDRMYGFTEIYDVKTKSVTMGPKMPFGPLHGAYAYPFGDTFVVAGGSKPLQGDAESTGTQSRLQK